MTAVELRRMHLSLSPGRNNTAVQSSSVCRVGMEAPGRIEAFSFCIAHSSLRSIESAIPGWNLTI